MKYSLLRVCHNDYKNMYCINKTPTSKNNVINLSYVNSLP